MDVDKYVNSGQICKESKTLTRAPYGLMGKYKNATKPWQFISLDLMGPFPRSTKGNRFLLVVCDWFTKYSCLFPLRDATAKKIVEIVENRIFLEYGVSEIIVADNGKVFTGNEWQNLIRKYNVNKMWYNTYYHPQNNFTERTNKVIGAALRSYVGDNHKKWDKNLPEIQVALRTAVNAVTGYTPFYLNYAREFPFSGEEHRLCSDPVPDANMDAIGKRSKFIDSFTAISTEVSRKMFEAYKMNKKYYDKGKIKISFNVGDTVYKRNYVKSSAIDDVSAKLCKKYIKCTITQKLSDLVYRLSDEDGKDLGKWHISQLKT